MIFRVVIQDNFDFTDLQEACDFVLKAKNLFVPEDKGDNPNVCIRFLDEHELEEVEE